jgi:hypothetical protein
MPTAITLAVDDPILGKSLQDDFSSASLRTYRNEDVIGTELGGALKNVIALAACVVTGLSSATMPLPPSSPAASPKSPASPWPVVAAAKPCLVSPASATSSSPAPAAYPATAPWASSSAKAASSLTSSPVSTAK